MTTTTKYVTNVAHEADCPRPYDRTALYLYRQVAHTQDAYFYKEEDIERINAGTEHWKFEEQLEPVELKCQSCAASRYVVIDKYEDVVALVKDNCPRTFIHLGHYGKTPCKYCGYTK